MFFFFVCFFFFYSRGLRHSIRFYDGTLTADQIITITNSCTPKHLLCGQYGRKQPSVIHSSLFKVLIIHCLPPQQHVFIIYMFIFICVIYFCVSFYISRFEVFIYISIYLYLYYDSSVCICISATLMTSVSPFLCFYLHFLFGLQPVKSRGAPSGVRIQKRCFSLVAVATLPAREGFQSVLPL